MTSWLISLERRGSFDFPFEKSPCNFKCKMAKWETLQIALFSPFTHSGRSKKINLVMKTAKSTGCYEFQFLTEHERKKSTIHEF